MAENEDKAKEIDYAKLAKEVTANVNESVKTIVDEKLAPLSAKVDKINTKVVSDDDEDDENDADDLDDDTVFTKKEVKAIVKKEVAASKSDIRKVANEVLTEHSHRANSDARAYAEFPMLAKGTPSYSREFESDVQKEMSDRVKRGRDAMDPDLVADAAATVTLRNPAYQKLRKESADEAARLADNRESTFTTRTTPKQSNTPSEKQLRQAERMGLSGEKLKEYMKTRSF